VIEFLAPVLRRFDIDPAVFSGDETRGWPAGLLDALRTAKLLRRTENAPFVECDSCGEGHVEGVQYVTAPPGTDVRCYIVCPDAGRVRVREDRILRWKLDPLRFAEIVSAAFSMKRAPQESVPSRLWFLGILKLHGRGRELFFARGVWWPDGSRILGDASDLVRARAPLVLTASESRPSSGVVSLMRHLKMNEKKLSLDRAALESDPEAVERFAPWLSEGGWLGAVGWYSHIDLARHSGVDADALRQRLNRFRRRNARGWKEIDERGPHEPRFFYQLKSVQHILDDLRSSG